ncbi:BrnT family toxin [Cupriavidus campinensis]|uniref:BrnT family toxin n=1 Tax=Cupriavidus campinensis TaxID=151783 RepID=UPI0011ECE3E0|nr:BrnT family toxin [Cupriavidus campinensis]
MGKKYVDPFHCCPYTNSVSIEFDAAKDLANRFKHGVSLEVAAMLDLDAAQFINDTRHDYNEARTIVVGPIGPRVYVMVYTMRGNVMRVITLRRANRREVLNYVDKANDPHS